MGIYAKYDNYNEETSEKLPKLLSLGNLGFSTTKCATTGMATDKLILSCKTGAIKQIIDFNIAAPNEQKDLCVRNTTGICSSTFNAATLRTALEKCIGKESCQTTGFKSYVTSKKDVCTHEDA